LDIKTKYFWTQYYVRMESTTYAEKDLYLLLNSPNESLFHLDSLDAEERYIDLRDENLAMLDPRKVKNWLGKCSHGSKLEKTVKAEKEVARYKLGRL